MMPETHYIKKQQIELIFSSEAAAEDQWQSLLDFHKHEGYEVMSDVFDRLAPGLNWIRIDSLQIDLGKISRQSFRQDYPGLLRASLEKALTAMIGNEKQVIQAGPVSVWETTIIHYLKYGTFLWETVMLSSLLITDNKIQARDILEEKITERMMASGSFIRLLASALRQHKSAMQRWIRQFSPEFHNRIKNILLGQAAKPFQSVIEKSCALIEAIIADKQVNAGAWYERSQSVKWNILFPGSSYSASACIKEWIAGQCMDKLLEESVMIILEKGHEADKVTLIGCLAEFPRLFNQESPRPITRSAPLDMMVAEALTAINIHTEISDQRENDAPAIQIREKHAGKQDNNFDKEMKREEAQAMPFEKNSDNIEYNEKEIANQDNDSVSADQEIYIDNAGMVLLAPFIEQFFIQAGINTAKMPEDEEEASLGIQLLQLLVANTWDEEEHRLAFNKILCGRSPEWPAFRIKNIPANAQSECTELLQSVLLHWQALKSTSVEALQETFLQRQGKLVFKDGQWQLWIEYKTQDILLESIPWSFSVIKLPWMKVPLYVNW